MSAPAVSVRAIASLSLSTSHTFPLIEAICSGKSRSEIEIIIAQLPKSVEDCDQKGYTPLHWAGYFDDKEAAATIIATNCDLSLRHSLKGLICLHIVAQQNSMEVINFYVQCMGRNSIASRSSEWKHQNS